MNRQELLDAIHAQTRLAREDVALLVASLVHQVEGAVARGEKVTITGFGTFEPQRRAPRTARNPRTGDPVEVPETTVPAFRPGQRFRDVVSGKVPPQRFTPPRPSLSRPSIPEVRAVPTRRRGRRF
jgi:DNA-binding protein HU-beta